MTTCENIRGKRLLITGGNRGLGRALVEASLESGAAEVWATTRKLDALEWSKSLDEEVRARLRPLTMDLTDRDSIDRAVDTVSTCQVVISNAAICVIGSPLQLSEAQRRDEWETNFFGPVSLIQRAVNRCPQLETIALVGSKYRYVPFPAIGNYCATKAALASFAESVQHELSLRKIQIQTFCPGAMDTEMSKPFRGEKTATATVARLLLQQLGNNATEVHLTQDAKDLVGQFFENPKAARAAFKSLTVDNYFDR